MPLGLSDRNRGPGGKKDVSERAGGMHRGGVAVVV